MSENALGGATSASVSTDIDSSVCPTCGEPFSSDYGVKQHHAKAHNESLVHSECECDCCGDTFKRRNQHIEKSENTFCSRDCYAEHISENVVGENHPSWVDKPTLECEYCGTEYEENRTERSRFCSKECMYDWLSTQTGRENPHWEGGKIDVACSNCGCGLRRIPAAVRNYNNHFCDDDCLGEWRSENIVGENHPRWVEDSIDKIYYGPNWERQKRKALKRDQYRCQRCLKTEVDLGRKPHVHHKKRIEWYKENYESPEWYEKGNDTNNLLTLCHSCHPKWEGIPLNPDIRLGKS